MTETDKVYLAITETMKKYSPEQVIEALKKYVTEGNPVYFTSTNSARKTIQELSPAEVMKNALISNVKYEQIIREKGYAQEIPNSKVIEKAIDSYRMGKTIDIKLSSVDLTALIITMCNNNVSDVIQLLAQNPGVLESFLAQYSLIVCNHRNDLNMIPNEQFVNINEYFAQFEPKHKTV